MERRLAAILAADVAGYTALMGADEAGTLRRLTKLRREFLEPLVGSHHGRIVKLMGDGLLLEFGSVVDAVVCALAWQAGMDERGAEEVGDKRLQFRIGINLGDVIVEEDDIYGDGVNLASRLEGLAEPGGICISDDAYRQVKGKVEVGFEDLGERDLKNVAEPVRVYYVPGSSSGTSTDLPAEQPLPLPDKPSIAVLPFANRHDDPQQEYFSDGVTEDIISELSKFRELFVIARNSSFSYKNRAVKIQDIAADLGVRYVLEGSVRAAGDRIRITTQLIDAESGHHIWSERYDRRIIDLFDLQDEIAHTVAGTVAGRLKLSAHERAKRKPITSLEAYDYFLRGQSIVANNKENNLRARQAYEKAIELDPGFARAYVELSLSYIIEWFNHWSNEFGTPLDNALKYAAKAVSLDNTDSKAQLRLGHVYMKKREYEVAQTHMDRALDLNPNDADGIALMGIFEEEKGNAHNAIEYYLKAMRLNPYYPAWYLWKLGDAYFSTRQYEKALIPLREALDRNAKMKRARLTMAISYAQLGRNEEAQEQVEILIANHPDTSVEKESQWHVVRDEDREHWLEGLQKLGLPEG